MPEPLDPFERRVADSLHARRPEMTPDVVGARAVFLERRRRRERKRKLLALAASGSSALTITLIAMLLNVGSAGSPSDSVGLAGGGTATEQPPSSSPDVIGLLPNASPTPTMAPIPNSSTTTGPTAAPYPGQPTPNMSADMGGYPGYASASPGVTSTSAPSPSPKPTATSSCSTAKEVSPGDSADCYVLHVGETLRVNYDESYWSNPETSDEKVLKTGETTHVQCVRAPCHGQMTDFIGNSVGTATVSAYGDPCKNNPPDQPMCGAPVQLWDIKVHVIA